MRRLLILIASILLVGCNQASQLKAERLRDTVEAIKNRWGFKPLVQSEAYAFINKYYLRRLDSLPTRRKIYIFPIAGEDFKRMAEIQIARLKKEYSGDTSNQVILIPPPPPSLNVDKKFKWDFSKLPGTTIIDYNASKGISGDIAAFRRRYGYGYMCISYPQYNAFTKRLVISEWLENGDWCGTGRDRTLSYSKIPGGWKPDN